MKKETIGATPGPWKIMAGPYAGGLQWKITSKDSTKSFYALIGGLHRSENARLIAAAPELLVELKKWCQFMKDNYRPEEITWWDSTKAAIAKAEGRG